MPIPEPKSGEDPQKFLSRCIKSEMDHVKDKHSDKSSEKQRSIASAICVRQYEKKTGREFPNKEES